MVVLSRGEPQLPAALDSLIRQSEGAEIVVSHSGPRAGLEAALDRHPGVGVDASDQARSPGGARNAGVRATRAPWVAFLAADCEALPGWVAGRIRRHRAGAAAVASAMAAPPGAAALASHLLQHSTRMPHVRTPPHLRFGLSYSREVIDRHGGFDEQLRAGEDNAMNELLIADGVLPELAPDVVTAHAYPSSLRALVRDSLRRGRLRWSVLGARRPRAVLAARMLADAPVGAWHAAAPGSGVSAGRLAAALPYLAAGGAAAAAGVLTAAERPGPV